MNLTTIPIPHMASYVVMQTNYTACTTALIHYLCSTATYFSHYIQPFSGSSNTPTKRIHRLIMPNILNNYKPQDPRVFPQSTISVLNVWVSDHLHTKSFECKSELLYSTSAVLYPYIKLILLNYTSYMWCLNKNS